MRRAILITLSVVALVVAMGWAYVLTDIDKHNPGKDVTHYVTVEKTVPGPERTVEKTVPGPERTVFKRKPGTTTWIIVCGENTQRVVGNKPFTECNLPDTGGG